MWLEGPCAAPRAARSLAAAADKSRCWLQSGEQGTQLICSLHRKHEERQQQQLLLQASLLLTMILLLQPQLLQQGCMLLLCCFLKQLHRQHEGPHCERHKQQQQPQPCCMPAMPLPFAPAAAAGALEAVGDREGIYLILSVSVAAAPPLLQPLRPYPDASHDAAAAGSVRSFAAAVAPAAPPSLARLAEADAGASAAARLGYFSAVPAEVRAVAAGAAAAAPVAAAARTGEKAAPLPPKTPPSPQHPGGPQKSPRLQLPPHEKPPEPPAGRRPQRAATRGPRGAACHELGGSPQVLESLGAPRVP